VLSLRRHLIALAEAGCTGALHVGGAPGGVLYLVEGCLAYAESPACPSVAERLLVSGRLSAGAWHAAYEEGRAASRVGRVLVRDGYVGQGELASRVLGSISEVTRELLRADNGPVCFVAGERHWFGTVVLIEPGGAVRRLRKPPHRVPAWS
jgi:hypothetical protein